MQLHNILLNPLTYSYKGKLQLSQLETKVLKYISEKGLLNSEKNIAKKLRISQPTLRYIIKKLEKEKVILDYKYRVDLTVTGISNVAWIFLSLTYNQLDLNEIIDYFLQTPSIRVIMCITGKDDIVLKIYGKNTQQLTDCIFKIEKELNHMLTSVSAYFVTRSYKQFNNIIPQQKDIVKVNNKDLKVLNAKIFSPKKSLSSIASELGIHRNTATKSWKYLLDNNIILKKSAIINPKYHKDIGTNFRVLTLFEPTIGNTEKLAEKLSKSPYVHELSLVTPVNTLLGTIRVSDIESYYNFLNVFLKFSGYGKLIKKIRSHIIMRDVPNNSAAFNSLGVV